jgi:hypothetical protein
LKKLNRGKLLPHPLRVVRRIGDTHFIFGGNMTSEQSAKNHTRWDPLFHFFAIPVLVLTLLAAIVNAVRNPGLASAWNIVFIAAVAVTALKARLYALKVQDRVIRLEERLRLAALVKEPLRARIDELTESQLVALRFASDSEVPTLFEMTLNRKLGRPDIKTAIQHWRPDYFRV